METAVEQASLGLLEYGLAGIFILTLILSLAWYVKTTTRAQQQQDERGSAREEQRMNVANQLLREKDETIQDALHKRHDDMVAVTKELAEGKTLLKNIEHSIDKR